MNIIDNAIFTNDNHINVKVIDHTFSSTFIKRDNHEVMFRRINSYLIKNKLIDGNIIDLGAWIGDNSIPWAMNLSHIIYAIDPSPNNINYIEQMAKINNIKNIKTIQKAISDKNEIIGTNHHINHCSFNKEGGTTKVESVTLDYLYSQGQIDNIAYIHLDVEGFEFNVIKGSEKIIKRFNPIISYEQHLELDNYKELSLHLYNQGYNIYLINEILPGCRPDCRNLLAFPKNIKIEINKINSSIGENVLLSVLNWNNNSYNSLFTATLYGNHMSNKIFENIKSVEYDNKHIFCVNDNNYTKIVVIDGNKKWLCGKTLQGEINILCNQSIINAYLTAQKNVRQCNYNIKDILQIK
jgi:FkbM family methyltransferase